jgi:hypothetical protein
MKTRKNLSTPLASTCFRGSSSPSCSCACLYCWKLISSLVISPSIFVFTFPASFRLHSWRLPFPSRALSPDFHAIRQPMPARSDSFAFGFRIFRGASATRAAFLRLAHVGIGCLSIHTPLHHFLPHLSISLLYTLGVGGAPICRHIPISPSFFYVALPCSHLPEVGSHTFGVIPLGALVSARHKSWVCLGPWPSASEVGRAAGVTRARRVSKFADCSRSGRPGPSQVQSPLSLNYMHNN